VGDPEAAHIFPHYMLKPRPKSDRNKSSRAIPNLWRYLAVFWGQDQIDEWKNTIFPDSQNPDIGVESCFNIISLTHTAHNMWNKGYFALKPLNLSRNRKTQTLTVQFFWQVPGNYEIDSKVDLLTETPSSKGLDEVSDALGVKHFLTRRENGRDRPICSGDTFTFTTTDPKDLPLPSMELLQMQWFLQRLVGMSGAARYPSLDDIDDDSVDNDNNYVTADSTDCHMYNRKRVCEWVGFKGITPEISTPTSGPSVVQCY